MKRRALFRSESMAHHTTKLYGSVCINLPVHYSIVTGGFVLLLVGFIIFGFVTDYTAQYEVKGYLNFKSGIAQVYPMRVGIIRKCFVVEGQFVKAGDALWSIETSSESRSPHDSGEYLQLRARKSEVEHQLVEKQKHLAALKPLLSKRYISYSDYQALRDDIGLLEASKHELRLALIHYTHSRVYEVVAPIAGRVSSIAYEKGQMVSLSKPLLTIVPEHAELIAKLYIPVSKSGFVSRNARVALRYDAYPYQHFGVATGHIISMAHSIMLDREEDKPFDIGEPYYKAVAALDKQTIHLDRNLYRLQQGMTCSVLISGVRKKVWQWVLAPQ